MQLIKNPRFVSEYKTWTTALDKIADPKRKNELQQLLNQLLQEVKAIDRQHEDLILSPKLPTATDDHRNNLREIRKKIHQKISELSD
jgi:uncharacterized protein YdhG (YjbR/CyaY superfamily)